jgi:hypothetical protein
VRRAVQIFTAVGAADGDDVAVLLAPDPAAPMGGG